MNWSEIATGVIVVGITGSIGWIFHSLHTMQISLATLAKDVDHAHEKIRDLEGQKNGQRRASSDLRA